MTTNHHTPIPIGAPANAVTFNTPLGQLDSAIDTLQIAVDDAVADVSALDTTVNNLVSGASGFTQLSIGTTTTLIISSGAITVTRSRHVVDTESSASYDDLDTILGGVAGDVLVLQSLTATRVVVVRSGVGNIFLNGWDVHLDNPRKALTLIYDGTAWVLLGDPPQRSDRRKMKIIFNEGTNLPIGLGAISTFGTPTSLAESDGVHTLYTGVATSGSNSGVQTGNFSLYQPRHNPSITCWLRTGSNVSGLRWYIGLTSGGPYAGGDNLTTGGISAVVFRYSTVAGDTGFRPVTCNGTTQTVHAQMAPLAINTAYKLQLFIVNGVAYFVVNDSVYFSTALTVPTSTTNLGWSAQLQTQENVAKAVAYRQILLETN